MREYLWRRRQSMPDREVWSRAKKRASARGVAFDLPVEAVIIPPNCPVLGIPLCSDGQRSSGSPSLDRIDPALGYVPGNVRVISDKANRLKGARDIAQLQACADRATGSARTDFRLVVEYVRRETLLRDVRAKAAPGKTGASEWLKIVTYLDRVFSRGQLVEIFDSTFTDHAEDMFGVSAKLKFG